MHCISPLVGFIKVNRKKGSGRSPLPCDIRLIGFVIDESSVSDMMNDFAKQGEIDKYFKTSEQHSYNFDPKNGWNCCVAGDSAS